MLANPTNTQTIDDKTKKLLADAQKIAQTLGCEGPFDEVRENLSLLPNAPLINLQHIIGVLDTSWHQAQHDHSKVASETTKEILLQNFQDTQFIPSQNKQNSMLFYQLFEQQVAANPQHPAVIYKEETCTYKTLNEKINRLAHYLIKLKRSNGWNETTCIGLFFENSLESIISILAVMKAGLVHGQS